MLGWGGEVRLGQITLTTQAGTQTLNLRTGMANNRKCQDQEKPDNQRPD